MMNDFYSLIGRILAGGESIISEQHRWSIPVINEISIPELTLDGTKDWADYFDRQNQNYILLEQLLLRTMHDIGNQSPDTNHFFIIMRGTGMAKLNMLPTEYFHHHVDCSANLKYLYRYGKFAKKALDNIDVYDFPLENLLKDKPLTDALVVGYKTKTTSRFDPAWLKVLRGIRKNDGK